MSKERAWAEVDLVAVRHNLVEMKKIMPGQSLMAVVKSNAYGHGYREVACCLQSAGVDSFTVATAAEGIALRETGIVGTILVLGYTEPGCAPLLARYGLTQTVASEEYALALAQSRPGIKAQVKVDTGMHRCGVPCENMEEIRRIFGLTQLDVKGIYTHFAVADSLEKDDVAFTQKQAARFFEVENELRRRGINPGETHLQSSYGVLNHAELAGGAARIGLALFGVLSQHGTTRQAPALSPALALKTRVTGVRRLQAGETVGYGREFCCKGPVKVATLGIGYADGVPRNMRNGHVLLHGTKAPVAGRISMDQMSVLVAETVDVKPGDVATLIGRDGSLEVGAEDMAAWSGTITNEVLSCIGQRVERVYIDNKPAKTKVKPHIIYA